MKKTLWTAGLVFALACFLVPAPAGEKKEGKKDAEEGFVSIFNGKDLEGWIISAETGHSRASKNKSGGKWVVEEGAIVGSQDIPANGGIIVTKKKYKNFEVIVEMNNDFGPDSGLFLRSTMDGTAYQALIDYHADGNLMGIYGEGKLGGKPFTRNYRFGKKVTEIIEEDKSAFRLPIKPEAWPTFWKHGSWNTFKVRIEDNPPHIQTWINGVKFMDFTETGKVRHPDDGHIALQVHGGGDFTKQFVRYKGIRVKELP